MTTRILNISPNRQLSTFQMIGTGFRFFMSALMRKIGGYLAARRLRTELEQLSDRELDDIGLCRADIDIVVRGELVDRRS